MPIQANMNAAPRTSRSAASLHRQALPHGGPAVATSMLTSQLCHGAPTHKDCAWHLRCRGHVDTSKLHLLPVSSPVTMYHVAGDYLSNLVNMGLHVAKATIQKTETVAQERLPGADSDFRTMAVPQTPALHQPGLPLRRHTCEPPVDIRGINHNKVIGM